MEGRKRKRQEVIDGVILTANLTKDASRAIAVLAPLEASMGMLITLLESIKDVRTNEENWGSLVTNISARIDLIRNTLKDKPYNTAVYDLVFNYSGELDHILLDLNRISKNYRTWTARAKNDAEKIEDAEKRMDEAFKRFESGLQLIIGTGIDALQTSNNDIIQTLANHSHDHAQNHAQILEQQQGMSDRLEDIQSKQKETISQMTEAEEINLIKGVNTASLANGGIHRSCMKGTRLAVLEEARKWMVEDDVPQLFWLNGVAGSGKSTVAKQLSEEWKAQGRLAGRFFFSRDAEETRSPKLFFTTIAQQGLSHLGSAPRTAVAFGIRKLLDPASATLEEQCSEIFEAPLQVIELNAVLVLDALDECELRTCQQLLRVLLPRLLNLPRLKIFLTSRPELHIREQLQRSTHHFLAFRIDAPENIQDVELYMRRTVDGLSLPEEQTRQLIERADGLFIWAKTVCELLRNIRGSRDAFICRVLNEGIRQMDSIYRIALEQAIRNNEVEESMEAYMNVLKVVVVAYEPLSPDAINQLLDISNGMEIVGDLRSVLECHGVDEPVRFLHPTFREFLLDSGISGQFYVDISSAHHLMATSCFLLMNKDLKYDLFNLFDNYGEKHPQGEFEELCLEKTSLGLKYSCIFWGSHVCATTITNSPRTTVISTIESFFTTNLIHWLYLIALVGTFNGATSMLRRLLSTNINENITKWSMDTMRFLRAHWNIIRNKPFHIYHYIAFTPSSSIFQQIYANSPSFPYTVSIRAKADWPPEVMIQSPHKIDIQSLSRCENWFATGGCSNNRAVFAIWDVQTADGTTAIHPCDSVGCSIYNLGFHQSANTVKLRTRCKCERLCIWDIASDPPVLLQEIQLESSGTCKWWSDDGDKAISERIDQLTDFTLMIFSLNILSDTGQISSLDLGVPYGPCRWKFSPGSGERVVQWSELTIIVWECSSRHQCFKKSVFPHQYGNFDQVCFSSDGEFILYTHKESLDPSSMWLVGLLSSKNGDRHWSRETEQIHYVEFFPDGDKILIGTDESVHIMSSSDGTLIKSAFMTPLNLSISPKQDQIAIMTQEGMKILDSGTLNPIQRRPWTISGERSFWDISWKRSAIIYITNRGPVDQTITFFYLLASGPPQVDESQGRNSAISKLFLSPDGCHVLIRHESGSIALWCASTRTEVGLTGDIIGKVDLDAHIEYTKDSSTIAIWEDNKDELATVNTTTGRTNTIRLASIQIKTVKLSASSKLIVIVYQDCSVDLISFKGPTLNLCFLGKISTTLTSIESLAVSPIGCCIAVTGVKDGDNVISIFHHETGPKRCHFRIRDEIPKIYSPQIEVPQLGSSQLYIPQIEVPQLGSSQLYIPQIEVPQLGSSQLYNPQIEVPQLGSSQLYIPQIEVPQIKFSQIEFTPNGSHLLVLTGAEPDEWTFSLITLSSYQLEKVTITNFKSHQEAWSSSLREIFRRLISPPPMTPPFIMKLDHDFKHLTTSNEDSLKTRFFQGPDAKMVVCPMLHRRDDDMYYGEHRLPTHHLSTTRLYDVSQTNLAYVDDDGHLVVINYSKFIDQIPSRSDFINIEYDCRKEWLKTLELSREAFSRGAFWPHYMGSPSDTNNWKIPIALLKQFGSPENILSMIEEGDQGAPLRDRVRAIRENERFMQALKGKWNESNEWNEWGVYRGYRPWGKSGNEICVLDR